VFSLGDSIGFGVGLEAKEHYCKVAQRIIRAKSSASDIQMINASGQGYSPSGYYVYLRNEGIQLNPSMVVVEIELCNDLTDEALLFWHTDEEPYPSAVKGGRYLVAWDGNLLGTYAVGGYPWERTYVYTDLLRRSLNLLNRLSPSPLFSTNPGGTIYYSLGFDQCLLDEERIERGWTRLLGALEATKKLCNSIQIPFLLLIMPSRHIYDDSAPAHRDLAFSLLQRAESEMESREIPYISMDETIGSAGASAVFFDFAHLTAEGNRAVGHTLAPRILAMLESAPADKSKTVENQ
jgi:hypothetical protein